MLIFYLLTLLGFSFFSYAFVDQNLLAFHPLYTGFSTHHREITAAIYIGFIAIFTLIYLQIVLKKTLLSISQLKKLTIASAIILLLAYPAMLSYDIFNYMTTAKILFFYHENPYIVMPIEFIGDPNLLFTRAINKPALYGPSWILLTGIPHFLGFGNTALTVFTFKLLILSFYLGTVWLLWKMTKNSYSLSLFILNPLVLIETIASSHNDIVMVFFSLLSFYLLSRRKFLLAIFALIISIFIKYASIFLIPIFIFVMVQMIHKRKINWETVYAIAAFSMMAVFFLSPLREEIYSWYVIWFLSFAVMVPKKTFLLILAVSLSITTLLRYIPVIYTGSYFGETPFLKEVLTFLPITIFISIYLSKKYLLRLK